MRRTQITFLAASLSLALLAGCKQEAAAPADTGGSLSTAIEQAEAVAKDAGTVASVDALEPNQRVQGTIQLDIGDGAAPFRSIATKIPDDLGKTTAERLGTAAGQEDLAGANEKVGGGKVNVSAQDVQDMANAFAGRTIYTSQMYSLAIIKQRGIELSGIAADGRRVNLNLTLPLDSDTPNGAKLEYVPNGKKLMQSFVSDRKDKQAVQVTLDRFERIDENTLSIAGSFKSGPLKPSVLAKDLAGQEIAGASGSFDFTEINIRPEK